MEIEVIRTFFEYKVQRFAIGYIPNGRRACRSSQEVICAFPKRRRAAIEKRVNFR
jgi:hypothetical protein